LEAFGSRDVPVLWELPGVEVAAAFPILAAVIVGV
jgi:hypothetical protein